MKLYAFTLFNLQLIKVFYESTLNVCKSVFTKLKTTKIKDIKFCLPINIYYMLSVGL